MEDNYSLWRLMEQERERWEAALPVCGYCGRPVQEDYYYRVGDENICPDCMENCFRVEREYPEEGDAR